jgi:hypothetical protein
MIVCMSTDSAYLKKSGGGHSPSAAGNCGLLIDLQYGPFSTGWVKMTQELRGALIALAMAAVVFAVAVGIAQPVTIFH